MNRIHQDTPVDGAHHRAEDEDTLEDGAEMMAATAGGSTKPRPPDATAPVAPEGGEGGEGGDAFYVEFTRNFGCTFSKMKKTIWKRGRVVMGTMLELVGGR